MKKILIANIFGIGDVLFTTPIIANIRKEIPGVSIDYLANARTEVLARNVPGVDDVFVYEKDEYLSLWKRSKREFFVTLRDFFRTIKNKRYDAVFDFTLSRDFGLFFKFAGIPDRIGLDYKKRGLFLNHKKELIGFEGKHVIEHYTELLETIGLQWAIREMELCPGKDESTWAKDHLDKKKIDRNKLIAVIPGGGASWGANAGKKRWKSSGFIEVADSLSRKFGNVAILGDGSEKELCEEISGKMQSKPAFVETGIDLGRYIALLNECSLVLCNDGGSLHIAVALGKKTVSVFGPVDQEVYGPYPLSEKHKVVVGEVKCRPCYNRFKMPECEHDNECLLSIEPETVVKACEEVLRINQ